jgi:hypothetical protein
MEIVTEGDFTLGGGLTFKFQGHDSRPEITKQKGAGGLPFLFGSPILLIQLAFKLFQHLRHYHLIVA